jgi:cytochrome c peroxidase
VALSGAHALGRCHAENSGYVGPWQGAPTVFSNVYYKLLAKQTKAEYWTADDRFGKLQYRDKSGTLMMLPSDLVLVQDDAFKKHVLAYAKDQEVRCASTSLARNTLTRIAAV